MTDLSPPNSREGHDAASDLDRADHAYQRERAGILSSAVGLARLALKDGDVAAAEAVLAEAAAKCSTLLRESLDAVA